MKTLLKILDSKIETKSSAQSSALLVKYFLAAVVFVELLRS